MPEVPTPREIAQSLLLGKGLPGFGMAPELPDLHVLIHDGGPQHLGQGPELAHLARWHDGIRAAVARCAAEAFVTAPDSFFALPAGAVATVRGRQFDEVVAEDVTNHFAAELDIALDDVLDQLEATDHGRRLIRLSHALNLLRQGESLNLDPDGPIRRVAEASLGESSAQLRDVLAVAAVGNLVALVAPVLTAIDRADEIEGSEVLDVAARSARLVSQLTGLTVPMAVDLRTAMMGPKGFAGPAAAPRPWHRDWVRVEPTPSFHLAPEVPGARSVMGYGDPGSERTVGERYRAKVQRDALRWLEHHGCLADIPLTTVEGGRPISAVRLLSLRLSGAVVALTEVCRGAQRVGAPPTAMQLPARLPTGGAAMEAVLRLDHEADVALARSSGRRRALEAACPVTRRRVSGTGPGIRMADGPSSAPASATGVGTAATAQPPAAAAKPRAHGLDPW